MGGELTPVVELLVAAVVAGIAALSLRGLPAQNSPALSLGMRAVMGIWACGVIVGLILVRTPEQRLVHRYRGVVLYDAALALRSQPLARAAARELKRGGGARPKAP